MSSQTYDRQIQNEAHTICLCSLKQGGAPKKHVTTVAPRENSKIFQLHNWSSSVRPSARRAGPKPTVHIAGHRGGLGEVEVTGSRNRGLGHSSHHTSGRGERGRSSVARGDGGEGGARRGHRGRRRWGVGVGTVLHDARGLDADVARHAGKEDGRGAAVGGTVGAHDGATADAAALAVARLSAALKQNEKRKGDNHAGPGSGRG